MTLFALLPWILVIVIVVGFPQILLPATHAARIEREIIGVVKDFNFKPVQETIGPMFLNRNTVSGRKVIYPGFLNHLL